MESATTDIYILDQYDSSGYDQFDGRTVLVNDYSIRINDSLSEICANDQSFVDSRHVFTRNSQTLDVILATSFLSVVALIGCVGNGLVIAVCNRYPSKQSAQHFILAMAICDFFVCAAIIPYRIISYHCFLYEGACKFFEGLTYFFVLFSMFLLIAVAVDRYHAVCKATAYHKMSKATGTLIMSLAIITLGISIFPGLIAGHYVSVATGNDGNHTAKCFTGICNEDGQDLRFSTPSVVVSYSVGFGVMYISMVIIVLVSYTQVFRTLYSRYGVARKKRRSMQTGTTAMNNASQVSVAVSICDGSVENGVELSRFDTQLCTTIDNADCITMKRRNKKRRSSGKISHRRTAKILLLVTIAFIITWIPFLLMKTHTVPNIVTIRLTFFISNMINPVIYSFTNRQFRENVVKLLKRRRRSQS